MFKKSLILRYSIAALILGAIIAGFLVMITARQPRQRTNANEAWLDDIAGLTPVERTQYSEALKAPEDRQAVHKDMKTFELCTKRYRRDGATDALSDFRHHRAKPFWGYSGGYSLIEWVPGLEARCSPPPPSPGVNLSREEWSRRGNFRLLDQMGSEFEDGQWRTVLTDRCERASRTYAARYNLALEKMDSRAFAQCRAATSGISYDYGPVR